MTFDVEVADEVHRGVCAGVWHHFEAVERQRKGERHVGAVVGLEGGGRHAGVERQAAVPARQRCQCAASQHENHRSVEADAVELLLEWAGAQRLDERREGIEADQCQQEVEPPGAVDVGACEIVVVKFFDDGSSGEEAQQGYHQDE